MTYAVGQLCIRTVYFSINDPNEYVVCSIYSIPVFPYFVKLRSQLWQFLQLKSTAGENTGCNSCMAQRNFQQMAKLVKEQIRADFQSSGYLSVRKK